MQSCSPFDMHKLFWNGHNLDGDYFKTVRWCSLLPVLQVSLISFYLKFGKEHFLISSLFVSDLPPGVQTLRILSPLSINLAHGLFGTSLYGFADASRPFKDYRGWLPVSTEISAQPALITWQWTFSTPSNQGNSTLFIDFWNSVLFASFPMSPRFMHATF